ncbi:MAG TPA: hypothetical protein VH351_19555 [Bryobacteraceae bacterium]|nr:hypothetical protein [Bryobacteraceae bacterium]
MFSEIQESRGIADHPSVGNPMRLTIVCRGTKRGLQLLRRAAQFIDCLEAEIELFVPIVTPYPLPLDRCPVNLAFTVRLIKDECMRADMRTKIELRLCRDFAECVRCGLRSESAVVLQKPTAWEWRDKMLIKMLRRHRHQVIAL